MHIIVFLYRKTRGNTFASGSQEAYSNFCAYVLAWVLPHEFSQNYWKSNCGFASHKHKNDYLWCLHDMLLMGHSIWEMSKCNVLVTTPGFCNQLEEVCFENSAGDRIFGSKNQLSQPRNISHKGDNTESKNNMSTFTDRTKNIDFRINKSD